WCSIQGSVRGYRSSCGQRHLGYLCTESIGRDGNLVVSWREVRQLVEARRIGLRGGRLAGVQILDGDYSVGHDRSRGLCDGARQRRVSNLRPRGPRDQQKEY